MSPYNNELYIQFANNIPLEMLANPNLDYGAKILYALIVIISGRNGVCTMNTDNLADLMKYRRRNGLIRKPSDTNVKKWLKQLADEKYITRTNKKRDMYFNYESIRWIKLRMFKQGCYHKKPSDFGEFIRDNRIKRSHRWII